MKVLYNFLWMNISMSNISFDVKISKTNIQDIKRFAASSETKFNALVTIADLDPLHDFRYSNMSGVDLSGANLDGFDFTGADLRGSYGVGIKWNENTIFTDADIENSVFSHRIKQKRKFAGNPEWKVQLDHIGKQDWAEKIFWFADEVNSTNPDIVERGLTIGYELFDTENDIVVKSNILLFSIKGHRKLGKSHRDFLIDIVNRYPVDSSEFRSALHVLSLVYLNDPHILNMFRIYLTNRDASLKKIAYRVIFNSSFFGDYKEWVDDAISTEQNRSIRNYYLKNRAILYGEQHLISVTEPHGAGVIDLKLPVSKKLVSNIGRAWARSIAFKRMGDRSLGNVGKSRSAAAVGLSSENEGEVKSKIGTVKACLADLKKDGVPLILKFEE